MSRAAMLLKQGIVMSGKKSGGSCYIEYETDNQVQTRVEFLSTIEMREWLDTYGSSVFGSIKVANNHNAEKRTNFELMFAYMPNVTTIDLSEFNLDGAISIKNMFRENISLTSLYVAINDTSELHNISYMCWKCSSLKNIDFSGSDLMQVGDTRYAFNGCTSVLTAYAKNNADVAKLNTSTSKPVTWNFVVKP